MNLQLMKLLSRTNFHLQAIQEQVTFEYGLSIKRGEHLLTWKNGDLLTENGKWQDNT